MQGCSYAKKKLKNKLRCHGYLFGIYLFIDVYVCYSTVQYTLTLPYLARVMYCVGPVDVRICLLSDRRIVRMIVKILKIDRYLSIGPSNGGSK